MSQRGLGVMKRHAIKLALIYREQDQTVATGNASHLPGNQPGIHRLGFPSS